MAIFKKTETAQGKWKSIQCTDNGFIDSESNEEIDIHNDLLQKFGKDIEFSLVASYKQEVDFE